jgi:predicted phosphodiesterase
MKEQIKFSVISDIHGNYDSAYREIEKVADEIDILFIAGDLVSGVKSFDDDNLQYFIDTLSDIRFKTIFVYGNHEFYNRDIDDRFINSKENFIVLDDDIYEFTKGDRSIYIFGSTLWTEAYNSNNMHVKALNDFNYIENVQLGNVYHKESLNKIKAFNKEFNDKETLIVTHHAPSEKSSDLKYIGKNLNKFFFEEIDTDIITKHKFWIHGHMHNHIKYMMKDTGVICNPLGYKKEETGFKMEVFVL